MSNPILYIGAVARALHRRRFAPHVASIKKQKYSKLRELVIKFNLAGPNEEYAYARYLKATEFAKYQKVSGCPVSYRALRRNMGLVTIDVDSDFSNPTGIAP